MKNLFLVDGASGTGKSDLLNYVVDYKQVNVVMKYTTRPQRLYEKEKGWLLDLNFVSLEEFERLKPDYVYKYRRDYWYGFYRAELKKCLARSDNVFVVVRSAEVINALIKDYRFINVVPVFIYTDQERIRERLLSQGFTVKELPFQLAGIREAFGDYLRHPEIYREVLINNSTLDDYHRLIDGLLKKYESALEVDDKLVFVLMSFNAENPELKDYFQAMKRAVRQYDRSMRCERVDEVPGSFKISDTAKKRVTNCRIAIVDLTENRPNVLYELGSLISVFR